jgi:hypothetical protein
LTWFAWLRSHTLGIIGVLAVVGVGLAVLAFVHIRSQDKELAAKNEAIGRLNERARTLTGINQQWADWAFKQQKITAADQEATAGLQREVDGLEVEAVAHRKQLDDLERDNAEVRDLLRQRLPDDLKRVLNQRRK